MYERGVEPNKPKENKSKPLKDINDKFQSDLFSDFQRYLNDIMYVESQSEDFELTVGFIEWWFSASRETFIPYNPYSGERPAMNTQDWIHITNTIDGEMIFTKPAKNKDGKR